MGGIDCVYPDDVDRLLDGQVEHGSRGGADELGLVAAAQPRPGQSAVREVQAHVAAGQFGLHRPYVDHIGVDLGAALLEKVSSE